MENNFAFWLRSLESVNSIATLGPKGTSSEAAAEFLASLMGRNLEIKLFDSFEQACSHTEQYNHSVLLVANAYRDVDYFYMNPCINLAGSFHYSPPYYYICCESVEKACHRLKLKKRITIATHRAPSSRLHDMIESLKKSGWEFDLSRTEIVYTESTSEAAKAVKNGISDFCLINEYAADLYQLDVISNPLIIEMVWTVFVKTNPQSKEHKHCQLRSVQL